MQRLFMAAILISILFLSSRAFAHPRHHVHHQPAHYESHRDRDHSTIYVTFGPGCYTQPARPPCPPYNYIGAGHWVWIEPHWGYNDGWPIWVNGHWSWDYPDWR